MVSKISRLVSSVRPVPFAFIALYISSQFTLSSLILLAVSNKVNICVFIPQSVLNSYCMANRNDKLAAFFIFLASTSKLYKIWGTCCLLRGLSGYLLYCSACSFLYLIFALSSTLLSVVFRILTNRVL